MINQQLLDFIKSQLLKGVDKETITKELLGSGWNMQDIEEGFSLATAKVINLTNNPTPIPSIDAETFNKGKKITYTIISTILTIGIATGLIFGDEISSMKDSLIKSIKGSKAEIINQINQEENIKPEIQQEETVVPQQEQSQGVETTEQASNPITQTEKNVILSEKNCGISKDTPILDVEWEDSYEGDPALKCFGESAASCVNAQVIITGGNSLDKNPALLQIINNNGNCLFKYTGYQSKYNQCPINSVKELDTENSTQSNFIYKKISKIPPERYAALIYNYASVFMPLTLDGDELQKLGCTGDLSQAISLLSNAGKAKMIETQIISDIHTAIFNALMEYDEQSKTDYRGICLGILKTSIDDLRNLSQKTVSCFDSAGSFAISVPSSSGGYLCEDISSGYPAKKLSKNITGPVCR